MIGQLQQPYIGYSNGHTDLLLPFSFMFRKILIIGNIGNDPGDFGTEVPFQLIKRSIGIFNHIVQGRRTEQYRIRHSGEFGQEPYNFDEMVDIGFRPGPFAALVRMPVGGEHQCPVNIGIFHLRDQNEGVRRISTV